jgi:hypothetical protein
MGRLSPGKLLVIGGLLVVFAVWNLYQLDNETPRGQAVTEITNGKRWSRG